MATKKVEAGHVVVTDEEAVAGNENATALDQLTADTASDSTAMGAEGIENATDKPKNKKAGKDTASTKTVTEAKGDGNTPNDDTKDDYPLVVLKKAASFRSCGVVYEKGVPKSVDPDEAERLLKTGLFLRG